MYVYNACWIMLVTSSITFQRANTDELTNFGMIYKVDRRLVLPSHSFTWLQGLCSGWHTHTHADKKALAEMCVCGMGEGKGRGRSFYLQQLLLINSKSFISPCVCVCVRICCLFAFVLLRHTHVCQTCELRKRRRRRRDAAQPTKRIRKLGKKKISKQKRKYTYRHTQPQAATHIQAHTHADTHTDAAHRQRVDSVACALQLDFEINVERARTTQGLPIVRARERE